MTIVDLIAKILKIPAASITDETAMKNVPAWDSLKHMTLILAIEQEFALELTGDEIADMTSVKAIRDILGKRGLCS